MCIKNLFLIALFLMLPSVSLAENLASFYSKGAKCEIVKPLHGKKDCGKKGIYFLEEGDILKSSYPVSIELLKDGYTVVKGKRGKTFLYIIGRKNEKSSLLRGLLYFAGLQRYSFQTNIGATRGLESSRDALKTWNPWFSLVFPYDTIRVAFPSREKGLKLILDRVDENGNKRVFEMKKSSSPREISFKPERYNLKKGFYIWKLEDKWGTVVNGGFYIVDDGKIKKYFSTLKLNALSDVKNPKLREAFKYEKLGYLWRFKNLLLSGNFSDKEINFALKEFKKDVERSSK